MKSMLSAPRAIIRFTISLVMLLIITIGALFLISCASNQVRPTITRPPTQVPSPTSPPPTATPSTPIEQIRALAEQRFDQIKSATWNYSGDRAKATIEANLLPSLNEDLFVLGIATNFCRFVRDIEKVTSWTVLEFDGYTGFVNILGKTSVEEAVSFTITRNLAAKVEWSNFHPKNLERLLKSGGDESSFYIHPVLRSAWTKYSNQ